MIYLLTPFVIFRTESSTTRQNEAKNLEDTKVDVHVDAPEILRRSAPLNDKTGSSLNDNTYPETYESIPYESIVEVLEEQMGGEPEHGSRNNFIFSMACHLRYVCNDDATWFSQILPPTAKRRTNGWEASRVPVIAIRRSRCHAS